MDLMILIIQERFWPVLLCFIHSLDSGFRLCLILRRLPFVGGCSSGGHIRMNHLAGGGRQAGGRQEYPQYGKRGAASVKTAEKGGSINVRE